MPDVREHLKNGARDSRQEFAFEGFDGVDLVLIARNHQRRHVDLPNCAGDVFEAGLRKPLRG
jgi:hypothetical protein